MYALLQVYNMLNIYILKFIYWALSYELTINSTIVYIVNRLLSPLVHVFCIVWRGCRSNKSVRRRPRCFYSELNLRQVQQIEQHILQGPTTYGRPSLSCTTRECTISIDNTPRLVIWTSKPFCQWKQTMPVLLSGPPNHVVNESKQSPSCYLDLQTILSMKANKANTSF